jgi:hypothetical protein
MENLIITNYRDYIGKTIFDWQVIDSAELPTVYAIVLKRNDSEKIFYIRRGIINGSVLNLSEDVYELWYKNFEDSLLLNSTDIVDVDIVVSKMTQLIQKYSSYE